MFLVTRLRFGFFISWGWANWRGETWKRRRKRVAKYWLELKPQASAMSVIERPFFSRNCCAARSRRHRFRNFMGAILTSSRQYLEEAVTPMPQYCAMLSMVHISPQILG